MNSYSGNFDLAVVSTLPRWFGRVVSKESWTENIAGEKFQEISSLKGWGYRYRVRIFNWYTADNTLLPDEQLVMANVVLPTTAGSGLGGSITTPSIEPGSIVTGFFLDGHGAQEPYIDGILGNSNNKVPKKQPKSSTGGNNLFNNTYSDSSETPAKVPDDRKVGDAPLSTIDAVHIGTSASKDQDEDFKRREALLSACKEDKTELKGIQLTMKNLIEDVEKIKKEIGAINSKVAGITSQVDTLLSGASDTISRYIKILLGDTRGFILDKVSSEIKKASKKLFPTDIPKLNGLVKKAQDSLSCVFNKIVKGLKSLIKGLLEKILDKIINAALCAAQNLLSDFLDKILNPILNAVKAALAPIIAFIAAATGGVSGIISALSGLTSSIGFISGIKSFFTCDDKPKCPDYQEISLGGFALPGENPLKLPELGASTAPPCPTQPQTCGPPLVNFFGGGGGIGALANAIISPISNSLIGFDIINAGSGFIEAPLLELVDPCGKGNRAVTKVNIVNGAIKNIAVQSPGDGYIAAPDGSLGGNESVWKEADEGYVLTAEGDYYVVPFGQTPTLNTGDVYTPPAVQIGAAGAAGAAGAGGVSFIPTTPSTIYPVLLAIDEIQILDPGFGYQPGDKILISPDNGAVLEPVINDRGQIESVKVIQSGIGFEDFPDIRTNSETGFNAQMVPIFKTIKPETAQEVPAGARIIKVIDCVGKIAPKTTFDIVPR